MDKTLNNAPGFLCPVCQKIRITVSLEAFLYTSRVVCPSCNADFQMDKSECMRMVELLQDLHVAHRNAEAIRDRG